MFHFFINLALHFYTNLLPVFSVLQFESREARHLFRHMLHDHFGKNDTDFTTHILPWLSVQNNYHTKWSKNPCDLLTWLQNKIKWYSWVCRVLETQRNTSLQWFSNACLFGKISVVFYVPLTLISPGQATQQGKIKNGLFMTRNLTHSSRLIIVNAARIYFVRVFVWVYEKNASGYFYFHYKKPKNIHPHSNVSGLSLTGQRDVSAKPSHAKPDQVKKHRSWRTQINLSSWKKWILNLCVSLFYQIWSAIK